MTPQQAAALTDEEANEALAKLTGWTQSEKGWWSHPTLPDNGGAMYGPPDYCNDLNAAHEVYQTLNKSQKSKFAKELEDITNWHVVGMVPNDYNCDLFKLAEVANATARQRCEALLVTMGGME